MFLIALFAPIVLAEDWPPNATINDAASLQVTPAGLDAVSAPVLLVGGASHTAFAFSHGIGPNGPTEADERIGQRSLERLRTFVARHPGVRVVYGHEAPVRVCDPVVAR